MFYRSRRSRVRTVPNSRANSSKQTKLDMEPVLGKRSRSASEEPFSSPLSSSHVSHVPGHTGHVSSSGHTGHVSSSGHSGHNGLEIRGTESLLQFTNAEDHPTLFTTAHAHSHLSRPRRLAKVETIRVLRARSALLLPLSSPSPSITSSLSCQPLVLKSEDRKKKRR